MSDLAQDGGKLSGVNGNRGESFSLFSSPVAGLAPYPPADTQSAENDDTGSQMIIYVVQKGKRTTR